MAALTHDAVMALLRESGALLEGHFRLSSGLHSPYYLQCARLLMNPKHAATVCAALKEKLETALPALRPQYVVAPALGGVVLSYELARQFGVISLFVERDQGAFTLRRGFDLEPGARVLVAEDVITTGLSTGECIAVVRERGAQVAAVACLIDRSGGKVDLGVPLIALATLDLPVFSPDRLPPELAGQPAVKPGTRPSGNPDQGA